VFFLVIVFNGWKERRSHETRKKNIQGVKGKVKVYQFRELKSVPPTPILVVL